DSLPTRRSSDLMLEETNHMDRMKDREMHTQSNIQAHKRTHKHTHTHTHTSARAHTHKDVLGEWSVYCEMLYLHGQRRLSRVDPEYGCASLILLMPALAATSAPLHESLPHPTYTDTHTHIHST